MSTSLVYHAFGARTYRHVKVEFLGGVIYFHLAKKPHLRRCVECRSKDVTLEGRGAEKGSVITARNGGDILWR